MAIILNKKSTFRSINCSVLVLLLSCLGLNVSFAAPIFKTNNSFLDPNSILPVAEAFDFNFVKGKDSIRLLWRVKPGYYLYKNRFVVTVDSEARLLSLRAGKMKDDPHFGRVEVYNTDVQTEIGNIQAGQQISLIYQGCAEVGVCYPPQKLKLTF